MSSLSPALIGLLSAGLLSPSVGGSPSVAQVQATITRPAPGVICDQSGPTCYDRQGPSIGHTQTYFGSIAANRLTAELRNRPPTNEFRLSNGAVCDLRTATCWKDAQMTQRAPNLTQHLFGSLPTANNGSGNGLSGLQTPRSGMVCDPGGQLCYDQAGLSLGLTREYFGSYAEQTALRNLNGQAPPRQFRLSNGSACDGMARTCWSDGWSRQRINGALSNQLYGGASGGDWTGQARSAKCRMTRWFKSIYNGTCELRESRGNRGKLLEVSLQDGNLYSISRPRGGSYQLSDSKGGIWPVTMIDQGSSINLTWSDRLLTVTPQGPSHNGTSLLQLINSLLGQ